MRAYQPDASRIDGRAGLVEGFDANPPPARDEHREALEAEAAFKRFDDLVAFDHELGVDENVKGHAIAFALRELCGVKPACS
jgi:predicted GNAT superfamily acetyltransferase